ncbi:PIG-L family deacetylase [Candidatus Saccharibacteria bacterium]|nr:PIG-L family deacetylase [Candidatus Saccharibacteria bacterium]
MNGLEKTEKALVLAPHPDDESIWCGGLLLKSRPTVVVMTDGCHGGEDGREEETTRVRHEELAKAMRLAGITDFSELGIEDGQLASADFGEIVRRIHLEDYETIFVPAPHDAHPDHAAVWLGLAPFIKEGQEVYLYDGWSALATPTHYLDISDIIEEKKRLVQAYASQESYVRYSERAVALAHYRGLLPYPAVEYAEAYQRIK